MPTEAMMSHLGTVDGVQWYWAEPGGFEQPGIYYWNGSDNVRVTLSGNDRPEWYGVQDEVALTRAVHVMNDVLGDIAGWEDKALAEAVKSSKVDLMAMIECLRMSADDSYIPGSKPIDGETFGAPTAKD